MEHYRCYRVTATKTGGGRITDTVQFYPHDVPMPGTAEVDRAIEAAAESTEAISKFKFASPLKDISDLQMDVLHKLVEIFHLATTITRTVGTKETTIGSR